MEECQNRCRQKLALLAATLAILTEAPFCWSEEALRESLTFYASFDSQIAGDFGGGQLAVSTRFDDPTRKGGFLTRAGFPKNAFRIAAAGKHGGCLEAVDVLPHRGRLFFPARGNIACRPGGWSGSVSFWLKTNPDTMLRTRFCDPIQITQKRAHDGALWIDFPDTTPRHLRLGAFTALADGEEPRKESDPLAPLIRLKKVGFQKEEWHHLVMTWTNFETGKADATVALWVDGRRIGTLQDLQMAMNWDLDQTGIYFAVNLIGQMDELAIFSRHLVEEEVRSLTKEAGLVRRLARQKPTR